MIPRVKFSIDSSKYLEKPKKIDNMSDAIHTRDPFASLSQKNSKKVLSPYRKLPKLAIALPPRLSLNSKKSARILDERSPQEKNFQENPKNNCNIINEEKKRTPKGKRIKISGSLTNLESQNLKILKKRNNVVVIDTENNVTFGLIGNIITKSRID